MKKIVITGGSGFIGSRVIDKMLLKGYEIINLDLKNSDRKIKTYNISILSQKKLDEIFEEFKPHIIIHCAGGTALSYKASPIDEYYNQYIGTNNIIEASNKIDCEKLILLSSDHVYIGFKEEEEVDENCSLKVKINPTNQNFRHLFGMSKLMSEFLCLNKFNNDAVVLRLASIYGSGDCTNLIKGMIDEGNKNGKITIWGDGKRRIQLTYLEDVVDLILNSFKLAKGIYNIANSERLMLIDIARQISKCLRIDCFTDKTKPEGPRFPYASNKKILSNMESFAFTPFEIGLNKILADYND